MDSRLRYCSRCAQPLEGRKTTCPRCGEWIIPPVVWASLILLLAVVGVILYLTLGSIGQVLRP